MDYILNSKQEQMKRRMCDLIDDIHNTEREERNSNLKFIKPELKDCYKQGVIPVNYDVAVITK